VVSAGGKALKQSQLLLPKGTQHATVEQKKFPAQALRALSAQNPIPKDPLSLQRTGAKLELKAGEKKRVEEFC
jgi:hypothetical protein